MKVQKTEIREIEICECCFVSKATHDCYWCKGKICWDCGNGVYSIPLDFYHPDRDIVCTKCKEYFEVRYRSCMREAWDRVKSLMDRVCTESIKAREERVKVREAAVSSDKA